MQTRDATCNMTCSQVEVGNCDLKSMGRAIIWKRLRKDHANTFWVCACTTGCSTSILIDMQ